MNDAADAEMVVARETCGWPARRLIVRDTAEADMIVTIEVCE